MRWARDGYKYELSYSDFSNYFKSSSDNGYGIGASHYVTGNGGNITYHYDTYKIYYGTNKLVYISSSSDETRFTSQSMPLKNETIGVEETDVTGKYYQFRVICVEDNPAGARCVN